MICWWLDERAARNWKLEGVGRGIGQQINSRKTAISEESDGRRKKLEETAILPLSALPSSRGGLTICLDSARPSFDKEKREWWKSKSFHPWKWGERSKTQTGPEDLWTCFMLEITSNLYPWKNRKYTTSFDDKGQQIFYIFSCLSVNSASAIFFVVPLCCCVHFNLILLDSLNAIRQTWDMSL